MQAREIIDQLHEDRRSEIHRKLDAVRKRPGLSSAYAQLVSTPFGPTPSYAEEDPSSEWWLSPDAEALLQELTDMLASGSTHGVKPGGPTHVYPGATQSWQQTNYDMERPV